MRVALLSFAVVACAPPSRAVEGEPPCASGELRACGAGACAGEQLCEGGTWSACYADGVPGDEICDGLDNDCDGVVDNGDNGCGGACAITGVPGAACDGDDGDQCTEGTLECTSPNTLACSDTTGTRVELCGDGTDDNCDGRTDEYCAAKTVRWSDHGNATTPGSRARALDVAIDGAGNVYVAGSHDRAIAIGGVMTPDVGARTDGVVIKYSSTGSPIWVRRIEGAGDAAATSIALAPGQPALLVWEGVTPYLTEAAVRAGSPCRPTPFSVNDSGWTWPRG